MKNENFWFVRYSSSA